MDLNINIEVTNLQLEVISLDSSKLTTLTPSYIFQLSLTGYFFQQSKLEMDWNEVIENEVFNEV